MFAPSRRRDFVHKRAHIVARAHDNNPLVVPAADTPTIAAAADPKPTNSSNPLTPVVPEPKTSDTPPSSSPTPSSPTPPAASAAPSPSSSSASSAASPASSSKSSLAASTAPTVATPLTSAAHSTPYGPSVSTTVVGVPFTPSSALSPTLSPSTTSSPDSSGGTNTGAIVGGVAGTLAGIAVLGFLLMWCMRRQRNRDVDDFDAQAFRRQSAVLLDDPVEPSRSYNPRPPTMIERHNASPALAAQGGYGQNFYGSYGGYGQQPSYPPEMIQPAVSPPPQAYGAPPMGYAGYNDPHPQQLTRQPSNAEYLTRQPSAAAGFVSAPAAPGSLDPNAQYIDLDRSSVSPYQAAQYADISRQLGTTNPNMEAPRPLDLPDAPLPSPFDDPVQATLPPHAYQSHSSDVTAPVSVATAAVPQTQKNVTELHERPATVYEEGDAYGGI